jgi:hypothetical protein
MQHAIAFQPRSGVLLSREAARHESPGRSEAQPWEQGPHFKRQALKGRATILRAGTGTQSDFDTLECFGKGSKLEPNVARLDCRVVDEKLRLLWVFTA